MTGITREYGFPERKTAKPTATLLMLRWAVDRHKLTGESEFDVHARFKRAAAYHYSTTWLCRGYWVKLDPPRIREPQSTYRLRLEKDTEQ